MSRAYCALKQYQQALPLVQEGLRRKPGKIDSLMLYGELGSIYYGLREYEKALAAYDEVTRIDPFFTPHFLMGDAYYELQRYPEAANSYNRAVDKFSNNANAYYRLALTYMRMGKKDEALGVYNRLLGIDPKRAQELYAEIYKGSAPTNLTDVKTTSAGSSGTTSPPPNISTAASAKTYTDLGFKHYKAKEYAKAIEAYQKALSLNPDLLMAHLFLGTIYLNQERWDLALASLKRALALRPDDSILGGLFVQMGAAQRELKQYDEALDTYRNQIRVMPTAGAHYWTGWIYGEKKGQYDKAVPEFREALRLQPDDAFSAYFLGDAYYHLKQYSNAVTAFREAIRLKANYAEAERYLGITFLALGQRNEALQTYQTLLSMDKQKAQELLTEINRASPQSASTGTHAANIPATAAPSSPRTRESNTQVSSPNSSQAGSRSNAEAFKLQGDNFRKAKDYASAIVAYGKAIAIDPSYQDAYRYLSLCYVEIKQWQLVVDTLLKWQKIAELRPIYLNVLGIAYFNLNDYAAALTAFRNAIRLQPGAEELEENYFWMAETYAALRQYGDAAAAYENVVRLNPNDAVIRAKLAATFYLQDQYAKALATVQEAIRLEPKNSFALGLMGSTYIKLGQYENAISPLQEAVRLDSPWESSNQDLGFAYFMLRRYPEAAIALQQAIRLQPDNTEAYFDLGEAYVHLRKKNDALQVYKKLLSMDKQKAQQLAEDINKLDKQ